MKYLNKRLHTVVLGCLVALVTVSACANKNMIRPGDSVEVAYKKALRMYRNEKFRDAAKAFETVINSARGTDYAENAYFYAADSYFESGQYLLAADGYERFASLYPRSPKRQEAMYQEAFSYYQMSPRYNIDQTYTKQSIEKFRGYLARYPNGAKSEEAAGYLTEMRQKLAHKNYHAGQLYLRTEQYKAAIIFYDLTIDQYPETEWAERALVQEISTYNEYARKSVRSLQRERYEKALDSYEKYVQLFPEGENRQRAEREVDNAREALSTMSPVTEETLSSTSSGSN